MPSRKAHLSIATAVGDWEINISKERWSGIEKAYGNSLPAVRQQIVAATNDFLSFERFERNAETVSAAKLKIDRIYTAASELKAELSSRAEGDDTLLEAQWCIGETFHFSGRTGRDALSKFGEMLDEINVGCAQVRSSCNKALEEINQEKSPGFRHGDAWDDWIKKITNIAAKFKLPTSASKREPDTSPFVRMIDKIQKCLPPECVRGTHSFHALSQAISRARAGTRTQGKLA